MRLTSFSCTWQPLHNFPNRIGLSTTANKLSAGNLEAVGSEQEEEEEEEDEDDDDEEEARKEVGRPWAPRGPAEFKTWILKNLHSESRISGARDSHTICNPSQVPVMVHKNQSYGLLPSIDAFFHHLPAKYGRVEKGHFRQLVYESPEGYERIFKTTNSADGDYFVPLGFLVEGPYRDLDTEDAGGRTTNYVWALNVSTTPKSLWLVYDYWNGHDDMTPIALQCIYRNLINEWLDFTGEAISLSKGFLDLGAPWDIVRVFDDVKKWKPTKPGKYKPNFDMRYECGDSLRALLLNLPDLVKEGISPHKWEGWLDP